MTIIYQCGESNEMEGFGYYKCALENGECPFGDYKINNLCKVEGILDKNQKIVSVAKENKIKLIKITMELRGNGSEIVESLTEKVQE